MAIHTKAMELLEQIYETCNNCTSFTVTQDALSSMDSKEYLSLEQQVNYLKDSGYISDYAPCSGWPISVKITPHGIRTIEEITDSSIAANITTVYGNNYGIAGNNNSSNTINNNFSFSDIKKIIHSEVESEEDRVFLEENLKPLYDRIELGAPIEQGMLSKISSKLESYQPLLSAVLSSVTTFLTATK